MPKDFDAFLSKLTQTNATLDYFVDFDKVRHNVRNIELKLHQLNFLIGKEDLQEAVTAVYKENPNTFDVLGILVSVRNAKGTFSLDKAKKKTVPLASYFSCKEQIMTYLEETGLAAVFRNRDICNLVDYVFGIEVGLSSHGRKNRGGANMAKAVSDVFNQEKIYYKTEIHSNQFVEIASLGADIKKFDFAIKTTNKTYLIEVNYYNSSGSKPNEVARAYSEVAAKINQYKGYEFVWITDGPGWLSSKKQLQEAWQLIPHVYNLTTLPEFIREVKNTLVIKDW